MAKGLGKGISALMDDMPDDESADSEIKIVDESEVSEDTPVDVSVKANILAVDMLQAGQFQPREHFDEEALKALSESIIANGVLQPIVVRPMNNEMFEIVAGERRWRASKLAGLREVPVIIRDDLDDRQTLEIALIENIQRQDLNPLEEADGLQRLIEEFEYTQDELSQVVGKSRSHISNLMRLRGLPDAVKAHIQAGDLSMGHARCLVNAEDATAIAEQILRDGLSVRQTEALIKKMKAGDEVVEEKPRKAKKAKPKQSGSKDDDIIALEEALSGNIGLKVEIFDEGQQGQVMIHYENLGELDEVLRRLGDVV